MQMCSFLAIQHFQETEYKILDSDFQEACSDSELDVQRVRVQGGPKKHSHV